MSLKDILKWIFDRQKPVVIEEIVITTSNLLKKAVKEIRHLNPTITEEAALKRIMQEYGNGK